MTLGENISRKLYELRSKQGLSQEKLAAKADMETTSYSRIERGANTNIRLETLDRIIKALDVSYPDFFTFSDSEVPLERVVAKLSLLEKDDPVFKIFEDILDWKQKN